MNPVDPSVFFETPLAKDAHGIWRAAGFSSSPGPVGYPDAGNLLFREVEDVSWWFKHRNAVILTAVRRFPPAGVLWDIGGGNGVVASYLQGNGVRCALLEAGEEGCRNAAARGIACVVQGRVEDLMFRKSALDAAGLFDVLEHAGDPDALLELLRRAQAGGGMGRLYLTVPAHGRLWSDEDDWAGHRRRFSRSSLLRLLERNGFRILHESYFFSPLVPMIFLRRAVPFRLKRMMGLRNLRTSARRAEKIRKDHTLPAGPAGRLFVRRLAAELSTLERGRISGGSSLLAVCQTRETSTEGNRRDV